jgi:hypothetical protein
MDHYVAANMDAEVDAYMENDMAAYVYNTDMAAYMDNDDVAAYVDDDVAA